MTEPQPIDPKINSRTWKFVEWMRRNKAVTVISVCGPLFGAIAGPLAFVKSIDIRIPRPVINFELDDIKSDIASLEIDYRQRLRRIDQRNLAELNQQIENQKSTNHTVNQAIIDQKSMLEEQIERDTKRIEQLNQR